MTKLVRERMEAKFTGCPDGLYTVADFLDVGVYPDPGLFYIPEDDLFSIEWHELGYSLTLTTYTHSGWVEAYFSDGSPEFIYEMIDIENGVDELINFIQQYLPGWELDNDK